MSERAKEYEQYLKSQEWAARRKWAIERAANRCQVCNSAKRLDVHHRTYERVGNEWPSDLTVLCRDCHELFHDRLPKPPESADTEPARHRHMSDDERRLRDLQRQIEDTEDEDEKLDLMAAKFTLAKKLREGK